MKCAPPILAIYYPRATLTFTANPHAIVYAEVFNPTLGYPGEGPFSIATYNINGTRDTLGPVLAQARQAKIDILLLQELHFYVEGDHNTIGAEAGRRGWTLVHSPATRVDPKSGVAIAVWQDSRNVTPIVASARSLIPGRYLTMSCNILGTIQDVSSVYLSAQARERKAHIHTIKKSKIFKDHAIIGGDFNCVENTDLDILYPAEGGGSTYANASGKLFSMLVAECGLLDAFRLVHGNETKQGHTRKADTVHTRIDRIYTQAYDSKWRWQKISPSTTTFTGRAKSDHLPLVAKIALAKERPPSEVDMKIDPAIFDSPNTRFIIELIWKSQIAKYPPEIHGHAKGWAAAKEAVATYLLFETSERRRKDSPISKLKKKNSWILE
jgi:exonuclease III